MRLVPAFLLCFVIGGCSFMSDLPPPPDPGLPPEQEQLTKGITVAIKDYHLAPPIEVTDAFRAPPSSTPPWMLCIRSGTNEAQHPSIAVFFGKDASGKDGQYLTSRYSVYAENCATQTYHPYTGPLTLPSSSPSPSPAAEAKKRHRHQQG